MSIASASGAVFRRLSSAFATNGPPSTSAHSRSSSVASAPGYSTNFANHARNASVSSTGPVYRTPNYVRNSVSAGCPTALPTSGQWAKHKLSMIPPTPATESDMMMDPFDDGVPPVPDLPNLASRADVPVMEIGPGGEMIEQAVV